jgi:putative sigma-54 modulation protein
MSTEIRIRPPRKNKRSQAQRGRVRAQGGKGQGLSAGRGSKATEEKSLRAQEPLIPAHIRSLGVHLNQNTRTSIRRKLDRKFGKFAKSIERLSVRLEDVNGPRGGVDHACRIKVVIWNQPSVVYEKQGASLDTAIGGALAGAERAVRRTLGRIRGASTKKRARTSTVTRANSGKES